MSHKKRPQKVGYQCNIRDDRNLVKILSEVKPHRVVHLCTVSAFPGGDVIRVYELNLIGTRPQLPALFKIEKRPKPVLLVSSGNVYSTSSAAMLTEDTPPCPITDYSLREIGVELLVPWSDKFSQFSLLARSITLGGANLKTF
jgi:UDP-glucose 4-epimerase